MTYIEGAFTPRELTRQPKPLTPAYRSTLRRSPTRPLLAIPQTLGEVTGPAFGEAPLGELDNDLILNHASPGEMPIGERIEVFGTVRDEAARPIPNVLVEVWQANAGGRYRHKNDTYLAPLDPNFGGCGRFLTGEDGSYSFRTIRPGPYPWPNGKNDWRPAHIHFSIFGAGLAQRLITQMYFEGDPHIPICPIVNTIPDKAAIDRLTARLDMDRTIPMDIRAFRFDLVLRGRRATFFENRKEGG